MNAQNRRAPRLERLEARDVPTVLVTHHVAMPTTPAALTAAQASVSSAAFAGGGGNGPVTPPTVAPGHGEMLGPPTPHELARERFVGRFKGGYVVGPGRFQGEAQAVVSTGYGGANQAFHLLSNFRISIPSDPTQPITGTVYMIPWNVGTTGTQLILDLEADPTSLVNGLPTRFNWSVDPTSAGVYTPANGYGPGPSLGTMTVRYFPTGRGQGRASQVGNLQYAINGLVNSSGFTSDIQVLGNLPNGAGPGTPRRG